MYSKIIKRIFDFCVALLATPFVLIVIAVFAPLIWLTDRGSVFYNAERIGKDGKRFKMFKLRSMYENSPDIRNSDGSTFNSSCDVRVTPIGNFLRKTSLDEIPQILNVLLGDMSFVGPRPTVGQKKLNEIPEHDRIRYRVRPGITGYAQAYYRNSIDQYSKYDYDNYYVENISFVLDMKILLKTFMSVTKSENVFVNHENDTSDIKKAVHR